jgi:hypothetical protein
MERHFTPHGSFMSKPANPPENIGTVPINSGLTENGKPTARSCHTRHLSLVREEGPDGGIVNHAVRRSAYIHERLHSLSGPPQKFPESISSH